MILLSIFVYYVTVEPGFEGVRGNEIKFFFSVYSNCLICIDYRQPIFLNMSHITSDREDNINTFNQIILYPFKKFFICNIIIYCNFYDLLCKLPSVLNINIKGPTYINFFLLYTKLLYYNEVPYFPITLYLSSLQILSMNRLPRCKQQQYLPINS